jgi:acyl carrier protein
MAMTEQEILAGLGEIVDEVAGVPADQVTPDKSFVDDLDIDSLSMVEIAVAAQDKFGVEIPDDQLKNLKMLASGSRPVPVGAGCGEDGSTSQASRGGRVGACPGRNSRGATS